MLRLAPSQLNSERLRRRSGRFAFESVLIDEGFQKGNDLILFTTRKSCCGFEDLSQLASGVGYAPGFGFTEDFLNGDAEDAG